MFERKVRLTNVLKWFYDTFTDIATRAARCGLLLEGLSLLSSQLLRKHNGHKDLRGSGHRAQHPTSTRDMCIVVCMMLFQTELNLLDFVICPTFYSSRRWQLHCEPELDKWP
jgi:hypothetical protein